MQSFKNKTHRFFRGDPELRRELKSQLRILIIATLGFTIAFSWRETIFKLTESIILSLVEINNLSYASIATSSVITIICLIIILFTSRFLRVRPEYM